MSDLYQKSNKIFHDNVTWLLSSDIRIREGKDKGALYGWQNLNPSSFPFIYSEITGYAVTCFSWIASQLGNEDALEAAIEASDWIIRNMHSNLLFARLPTTSNETNPLSNLFYSFDNSMIAIGILSLYKMTKKVNLLQLAQTMIRVLIDLFFDGEKLIPRLDNSFNVINHVDEEDLVKWSTIPGAYHSKFSIGLLQLSSLTQNKKYARVSDSLCDFAIKLQKPNGRFITNPGSDVTYLHPHLYACEGLIYSGIKQSNESHHSAGLKGVRWAMEQIDSNGKLGLIRNTGKELIEQSDCTAQLLRLLILCQSELEKSVGKSELSNAIEGLHLRLLDFYIPDGEGRGGMKYQFTRKSACSWCTMFSMQALNLWKKKNFHLTWIDYFV
jgi:hypothetical protein